MIKRRKGARIVTLYGLGGVGKTTLAKAIVSYPQKKYSFRVFFNAETESILKKEYFELGEYLKLFTSMATDNVKIKILKEFFENQDDILVIYDNVKHFSYLRDYIPAKGDILITSRNYKLPGSIEVGTMNPQESIDLLKKFLKSESQNDKSLKKVVEILGYLPLAITQAGGYMSQNYITAEEYLSLYNQNRSVLMKTKSFPEGHTHEPAYVTWSMNMEKIRGEKGGEKGFVRKGIEICVTGRCCFIF